MKLTYCLFTGLLLLCLSSTAQQGKTSPNDAYLIQDSVLIKTTAGHTLSAVVVRKKGITSKQPAALLFFIYANLNQSLREAKDAADRGYVGVVADVRGKRLSPDELVPYENEQEDVYEVIDWISKQSWSNQQVGMYGGSYSGFAQWAALKHRVHPALKTIVPYVAAIPGMGLPMENNVFINANYQWAFYVGNNKYLDTAANNDRWRWRKMNFDWYTSGLPYRKIDSIDGKPNPLLQRWLQHPAYDTYWQSMVPYQKDFAKINIPILAIDGYYNDGQTSGLHYLREHLRYRPDAEDYLVIGPYDHFGAQKGGVANLRGYQVDSVALINTRALTFEWFDYVMKGAKKPGILKDRINFQVMGSNSWRHVATLDEMYHKKLKFYLSDLKLTAYHTLTAKKPESLSYLAQAVDFNDRERDNNYDYPDPIVQNELMMPNGYAFVTDTLKEPLEISGAFSGLLNVAINRKDLDFSVTLYEIMPDGRFFEFGYYLGRASYADDPTTRKLLTPGKKTSIKFSNTKIVSKLLAVGSRFLVIVNANKNPFGQVNYGTGKDVSDESIQDAGALLKIKWYNDSFIEIPVR